MEYESSCTCLKRYRKYVGVLDLLLGVAGIFKISCVTFVNRRRRHGLVNGTEKLTFLADDLNDELSALDQELQTDGILYVLPSVVLVFLGILILIAAKKDSFAWSKAALALNIALLVLCGGIVGVTFGLGTYWMQLIPLVVLTGIQGLFLAVVLELYHSTQHLVKLK